MAPENPSDSLVTLETGVVPPVGPVAGKKPRGRGALRRIGGALVASLVWIVRAPCRAVRWISIGVITLLKKLIIPNASGPLEYLKHYLAVVTLIVGVTALVWTAKQILNPPLVITVADLPESIKAEKWLGIELPRALMHEISEISAAVKGERDPNFEAVLNPPNIVIKSGDLIFNFQDQLLTPLSSVLGRPRGEIYFALTCRYPNCAQTTDSECRQPVAPVPATAGSRPRADSFLCLLATVDLRKGGASKRIAENMPLVFLNGGVAKVTKEMQSMARSVTTVADPATAALYYQRVLQNRLLTDDAQAIEIRGEAFQAAAIAEDQDPVSACWAHSVRAGLAIDRREYVIANSYIKRAEGITPWNLLLHFKLPSFCDRLVASTKLAFARRLSVRTPLGKTYPPYEDDDDLHRGLSAFVLAAKIADELSGRDPSWITRLENWWDRNDRAQSAFFVRAEIAINVVAGVTPPSRARLCQLVIDTVSEEAGTVEADAVTEKYRTPAAGAIVDALRRIRGLERPMGPLSRQAVMDFMQRLPRQRACLEHLNELGDRLHRIHPDHAGLARQFAEITAARALAQTEKEKRAAGLRQAQSIFERLVDIGNNKDDVHSLGSLAFFRAGFGGEVFGGRGGGQNELAMRDLKRAWRKFELERYPPDVRFHAENVIALWGALLLGSQPKEIVMAKVAESSAAANEKPGLQAAREFLAAVRIFSPAAQPRSLSDTPALKGIGQRIGCVCMLSEVARTRDNPRDFYLQTIFRWQNAPYRSASTSVCLQDLDDGEVDEAKLKQAKRICYLPKDE